MITLRTKPGDKLLEMGGGAAPQVRPNADVRQCYDAQGNPTVDFVIDFEQPLPFADQEWDGIFSQFSFEHVSYTKIGQLLAETFRILKPGGKLVIVVPNTSAQLQWIIANPNGWDGKDFFTSASEILYGSQDYQANAHKSFFNPVIITELLQKAGFEQIHVDPYGSRDTDMVVQAIRPNVFGTNAGPAAKQPMVDAEGKPVTLCSRPVVTDPNLPKPSGEIVLGYPDSIPREEIYNKDYFNGGGKVGGYAREGYWDYPVHWVTLRHILDRRPESVLEIGCARGYLLKRLQDLGIRAEGLEVSKHCFLTRACDGILQHDICNTPWPIPDGAYDLCFSIAVLEHIPEDKLPAVLNEIHRTCRRGLHGIDFGDTDDGFDQTHCTLKDRNWWVKLFAEHGVVNPDIYSKHELEQGQIPLDVIRGDGKIKLNLGCFITQFHHGWVNVDGLDLNQFAQANGYQFRQHDLRTGLPYKTGEVDLIFMCHVLEHFDYRSGLALLRECRRALKPDGAMRILVPDASLLTMNYASETALGGDWDGSTFKGSLSDFDEMNDGASACPTAAGKLWSLLFSGHQAMYDYETLARTLSEAGFTPHPTSFRKEGCTAAGCSQIIKETTDMQPAISLFMDATPQLST